MNPWRLPHSSEHWPCNVALELQEKHKEDNLPGIQSTLKPRHGTVNEWITSTAVKLTLYLLPQSITKQAKVLKYHQWQLRHYELHQQSSMISTTVFQQHQYPMNQTIHAIEHNKRTSSITQRLGNHEIYISVCNILSKAISHLTKSVLEIST
jgi:hypothetical protein